ncbi:MAG: 5-formyltetrahydrofolate cyclo-ligase [Deltaproteobacteria bacterium]|nr:MAG: 5-formyltetrahydrofolate cyclo-ligase [Deltaproteobacteria bacterium]
MKAREEKAHSAAHKARIREETWELMQTRGLSPAPQGSIPTFPGQNKAAERLRGLGVYRKARTVMVPPDQAQLQVRVNALLDGKRLIMATPGLRDGFYLLEKDRIRIKDLVRAVRSSGVRRFGKRLFTSRKEIGEVDLLVTGAVAVGLQGGRIGKGSGYFDLEYMILRQIGSVKERTLIVALVDDLQVREDIPMEEKDVAVDFIVTPTQVIKVEAAAQRPPRVLRYLLDVQGIKRMRPIRELGQTDGGKI